MSWHMLLKRGSHPPLFLDAAYREYYLIFPKIFGFPSPNKYLRTSGGTYLDDEEYNRCIFLPLKSLVEKDHKKLVRMMDNSLHIGNGLIKETRKFNASSFSRYSSERMVELFSSLTEKIDRFWINIYLPFYIDDIIDDQFRGKDSVLKEQFKEAASYIPKTPVLKERLALIEIAKGFEKSKKMKSLFIDGSPETILKKLVPSAKKKIELHKRRYPWINCYLLGINEYSLVDIISRIKHIMIKGVAKELDILSREEKRQAKANNDFRKAFKKDKTMLQLLEVYRTAIYLRNARIDIANEIYYYLHFLIEEMAKRHGLSYSDSLYLREEELVSGKFSLTEIERRKVQNSIYASDGKILFISEKEADKMLGLGEEISGDSVKGMSVSKKGIFKGKVIVITSSYEYGKMSEVKDKVVFVCGMTTPNIISFMSKITAIVTDEGGATCHAAIISREFGVPCIIGTKNATKYFKDGDIVEVDADNGVVKKVSQSFCPQ